MKIINSIEHFLAWIKLPRTISEREIISKFKSSVYEADKGFYDFKYDQMSKSSNEFDNIILEVFRSFDNIKDRFIRVYTELNKNLEIGLNSMLDTFPDFHPEFPIHICHSLGECDGGLRKLGEQDEMIIGIDIMARVHNWDNEIPFIQHELFHVYHDQIYKPSNNPPYHEDALYNALWSEGLATYISHILNPDASPQELLLDIPKNLIPDVEKDIKKIASEILKNLHSTDSEIYAEFFLFKGDIPFPKRSGYYIGYLLAKEVAKHYRLDKLIRLQEDEFLVISDYLEILSNRGKL